MLKNNPISKSTIKVIITILLLPMPIVFLAAYKAGLMSIDDGLSNIADGYVHTLDDIIEDLRSENLKALRHPENCERIQQDLLFESVLREMFVIKDRKLICSSKRGESSIDVSDRLPESGLRAGVFLYDLGQDIKARTLIVVDVHRTQPNIGVVSGVEKQFVIAKLGYTNDSRVKRAVIRSGTRYFPVDERFESDTRHTVVKSKKFGYEIFVEASADYSRSQQGFFLLSALPVSLALSALIFILMMWSGRKNTMLSDIKKALARQEFFLVYQPVVDIETNQISGFEALMRWIHPQTGYIRPDTFIALAEEHNLINELTDYVFDCAYRDCKDLVFKHRVHIGINVPPSYLNCKNCLENLKLNQQRFDELNLILGLEITERQLLDKETQSILDDVRALGIDVAIDDFGTGHTALSVMQNIRFDYLKIDKCFVDTIGIESINAPVLNSIIELGHQLNVHIIAEGVETLEQVKYLTAKGVRFHQGYYYYRPMMLNELKQLI